MKTFSVAVLCIMFASTTLAMFCGLKYDGAWKTCQGGCGINELGYSTCIGAGGGDIGDIGTPCAVMKSRASTQPAQSCDSGKGCGYLYKIKDMGCH